MFSRTRVVANLHSKMFSRRPSLSRCEVCGQRRLARGTLWWRGWQHWTPSASNLLKGWWQSGPERSCRGHGPSFWQAVPTFQGGSPGWSTTLKTTVQPRQDAGPKGIPLSESTKNPWTLMKSTRNLTWREGRSSVPPSIQRQCAIICRTCSSLLEWWWCRLMLLLLMV